MAVMTEIMKDNLYVFVVVFVGDILIYSRTQEEHKEHVKLILAKLREYKLYANKMKCELFCK